MGERQRGGRREEGEDGENSDDPFTSKEKKKMVH
jgi:hypothetical protein